MSSFGTARHRPSPWQLDVRVAWISILPKEYYSALCMLDETYDYNEKGIVPGLDDDNRYELGRIGKHDVVMNCPTGSMGYFNAHEIANKMRGTFINIRVALLVGIGGGAPNLAKGIDVRLGDVVVSNRIVPYRSGKMTDRGLEPTGATIEPESNLLAAATSFQGALRFQDASLHDLVCQAASKPKSADLYIRPPDDRLFLSGYYHGQQCQCASPQLQDLSTVVARKARPEDSLIHMHIGAVGSADQVLKNARERDALSKAHEIVCFEMEAAVVMRGTCITVRGICDYCDGHKNDAWHDYAALSAAVCARELLKRTSPNSIKSTKRELSADDCSNLVHGTIQHMRDKLKHVLPEEEIDALNQTLAIISSRSSLLEEFAREESDCLQANSAAVKDKQQVKKTQDVMKRLDQLNGELTNFIQEIRQEVDCKAAAASAVTRQEWEELKTKVDDTAREVEEMKTPTRVLDDTAIVLDGFGRVTQSNKFNVTSERIRGLNEATSVVTRYGLKLPFGRTKEIAEKPSHQQPHAATSRPYPQPKIQQRRPLPPPDSFPPPPQRKSASTTNAGRHTRTPMQPRLNSYSNKRAFPQCQPPPLPPRTASGSSAPPDLPPRSCNSCQHERPPVPSQPDTDKHAGKLIRASPTPPTPSEKPAHLKSGTKLPREQVPSETTCVLELGSDVQNQNLSVKNLARLLEQSGVTEDRGRAQPSSTSQTSTSYEAKTKRTE